MEIVATESISHAIKIILGILIILILLGILTILMYL
jgi:hypothetical protein